MEHDKTMEETQETMKKVNEILEEAGRKIEETDALYEELGITRGKVSAFIDGDKFHPELKQKAEEERARLKSELDEEVEAAVMESQSGKGGSKLSMKKNFIRI